MFSIRFKSTVVIEGCPESGVAAIDWRREHGLPESPTNQELLEFELVDEQLVRELGGGDSNADILVTETCPTRWHSNDYGPRDRWVDALDENGTGQAHHTVSAETLLDGPAAILREIYAATKRDVAAFEERQRAEREYAL